MIRAPSAVSWELKTERADRVAAAVAHAFGQVPRPGGGLVFVAGHLAGAVEAIAEAVAAAGPGRIAPVVVAAGASVLTERGQLEEQSAATGLVWSGGRSEIVGLPQGDGGDVGEALGRALSDRTGSTAPTALVFLQPEGFGPNTLAPLAEIRGTRHVLGGGTAGQPGAAGIDREGRVTLGSVALLIRGLAAPVIRAGHSCRLLGPLQPITACRGSVLLEIAGQPALDALASHGERLASRPLILMVLAEELAPGAREEGRPSLLVRGIQGVDPDRRAILVTEELREGMRVAFAVRDPRAAREDYEAMSRELERDIAGAAPRFGVVFDCAGRGSGLYGAHDVDAKILRARFPNMPFAGMASAFEIAPYLGKPALQLYTSVVALFTSPS